MSEKESVQDDQETYPSPIKQAVIVTALCLAIFCMALVSTIKLPEARSNIDFLFYRITQSLRQPFLISQANSMHSTM